MVLDRGLQKVAPESRCRSGFSAPVVADVAASFEATGVEVLVTRAQRAVAQQGLPRLTVVGGVAAIRRLLREMTAADREDSFELGFPPPELCTDNAAMIAAAAARLLARGEDHGLAQRDGQSDEDASDSKAADYRREPVAQDRSRQDLEPPEEVTPMNNWR
jgi:tRNA A37 threonylcarbamoyltransferase TsaD